MCRYLNLGCFLITVKINILGERRLKLMKRRIRCFIIIVLLGRMYGLRYAIYNKEATEAFWSLCQRLARLHHHRSDPKNVNLQTIMGNRLHIRLIKKVGIIYLRSLITRSILLFVPDSITNAHNTRDVTGAAGLRQAFVSLLFACTLFTLRVNVM